MNKLVESLENNPIIAAIKEERQIEQVIKVNNEVVFLLGGNLIGLKEHIRQLKCNDKIVFLHFDLIDGLGKNITALNYIHQELMPDGIISTKANIIHTAKKIGLLTVYRCFIFDSISLQNAIVHIKEVKPDAVEILPGVISEVIEEVGQATSIPIIAGGLIVTKEHIVNGLKAGAMGISTTKELIWIM